MENIGIQTTQNVDIQYNLANIGDRVLAQVIDLLIMFGYMFGIIFLLIYLNDALYGSPFYYPVAYGVILFIPLFFYDFLCEMFLGGQSFGKKILKNESCKD